MPEGLYHPIHTDEPFTLGDIDIHPFAISHDANEPAGYRLECGSKVRCGCNGSRQVMIRIQ